MVVGLLTVQMGIDGAASLKDKRQVIKSVLAHLRSSFNVSVAEVADHDIWQRAVLGIALVASDTAYANAVLDKVIDHLEREPRIDLGACDMEFL